MPDNTLHQPSKSLKRIELAVLGIVLVAIAVLGFKLIPDDTASSLARLPSRVPALLHTASPSPSPAGETPKVAPEVYRPPVELPSGSQTYHFSNGKSVKGPKISSVTIDPLTPKLGAEQTVNLSASYDVPITEVTVESITDSQSESHQLTRSAGTDLQGTWTGTWKMNNSYDQKYGLRLILKSSRDTYDNTMWFRQ